MRFTGNPHRKTVTINLTFLDTPVTITSLHDLPLGTAMLFQTERVDEGLQAALPEDLAHILLHQATSTHLEEFFTAWQTESTRLEEQTTELTTPEQFLRNLLGPPTDN